MTEKSLQKDKDAPGERGLVEVAAVFGLMDADKKLTNRQRMDILIEKLPRRTFREGGPEKLQFLLGHVGGIREIAEAFAYALPKLEAIIGAGTGISKNNIAERTALNIPVHDLVALNEVQCGQVLEVLAPVIERSFEINRERQQLDAIVGSGFFINRWEGRNGKNPQYEFTPNFGEMVGYNSTAGYDLESMEREKKAEHNFRHTMRHMTTLLNNVLGKPPLFEARKMANHFTIVAIDSDNAQKLFAHPKLKDVQALFANALEECKAYESRSLLMRVKGMLGLKPKASKAVPALEAKPQSLAKPDALPYHPADDRKGPLFTERENEGKAREHDGGRGA